MPRRLAQGPEIGERRVRTVCPDGCRIDTCVTFLWLAINLKQESTGFFEAYYLRLENLDKTADLQCARNLHMTCAF
jgi:hypothetical protein